MGAPTFYPVTRGPVRFRRLLFFLGVFGKNTKSWWREAVRGNKYRSISLRRCFLYCRKHLLRKISFFFFILPDNVKNGVFPIYVSEIFQTQFSNSRETCLRRRPGFTANGRAPCLLLSERRRVKMRSSLYSRLSRYIFQPSWMLIG